MPCGAMIITLHLRLAEILLSDDCADDGGFAAAPFAGDAHYRAGGYQLGGRILLIVLQYSAEVRAGKKQALYSSILDLNL
jgi:hypothetical protein